MDINQQIEAAMRSAIKEAADDPAIKKLDADIAERKEVLKSLKGEITPNKQSRH